MSDRTTSGRDVFTFSLSGLRAMAGFTAATAIAQDQINKAWDERLGRAEAEQPHEPQDTWVLKGRFWLLKRLRAA